MIEKLDDIWGREVVKEMGDGIEGRYGELRIVEDMMVEEQLEGGVMNVVM